MSALDVVIPTYNQIPNLYLILEAYAQQTDPEFEIRLVNDGGDESPFPELLRRFSGRLRLHYHYLDPAKQPGEPCRQGLARNLGVQHARADRILFTDGDCIPDRFVVAHHKSYRGTTWDSQLVLVGQRRMLDGRATQRLLRRQQLLWPLMQSRNAPDMRMYDTSNRLTRAWQAAARRPGRYKSICWTCHISYPRAALQQVGGFWEEITGWGGEDIELAVRVMRAGYLVEADEDAIVYHLDHPWQPRNRLREIALRRRSIRLYHERRAGVPT